MHDVVANREKIMGLENAVRTQLPQVKLEAVHHFAPGVYARELTIPAGIVVTGKIHKTEHLNIIAAGRAQVYSDGKTFEICAPMTFVSYVGAKKAVYAYEDTTWITVHVTEETDVEKIEDEVIAKTFELLDIEMKIKLEKL